MQGFFNIIEECNGAFRLCFMTGITKYTGAGSLSPINNFEDLSSQPTFSDFIGYTAEEIRDNFQPYLARAAAVLGETEETVLENMGVHYDGYCFDFEMARHVFCPWTVLQFLKIRRTGISTTGTDLPASLVHCSTTSWRRLSACPTRSIRK